MANGTNAVITAGLAPVQITASSITTGNSSTDGITLVARDPAPTTKSAENAVTSGSLVAVAQ